LDRSFCLARRYTPGTIGLGHEGTPVKRKPQRQYFCEGQKKVFALFCFVRGNKKKMNGFCLAGNISFKS